MYWGTTITYTIISSCIYVHTYFMYFVDALLHSKHAAMSMYSVYNREHVIVVPRSMARLRVAEMDFVHDIDKDDFLKELEVAINPFRWHLGRPYFPNQRASGHLSNERGKWPNPRALEYLPSERRNSSNQRVSEYLPNEQRNSSNQRVSEYLPNEQRNSSNQRVSEYLPNERGNLPNQRG